MLLDVKPEVLAPAGTLDAVSVVLQAGADAVYLGGKRLNMRMHRSSYNLSDEEVAAAVRLVHEQGKKLYFTLNNLLRDSEVQLAREQLSVLAKVQPDAIIVQDLAVAALAREVCPEIELHASTMMNVHSARSASVLKEMGFTRIITSRDIPLHEVRQIGEKAGIETEYFVHGDMCISQSSQCLLSGVLFGESSNRGRCMKPCRWQWRLVAGGKTSEEESYLLAYKDLCLLGHIPALVENRIASLKIEGRMRTADYLSSIVGAYRKAVDAYWRDPYQYVTDPDLMREVWDRRTREFSTCRSFGSLGPSTVDPSGNREPRFFSQSAPTPRLTEQGGGSAAGAGEMELVVHVGTPEAATAALEAGADAIYLGGEVFPGVTAPVALEWLSAFSERVTAEKKRVVLLSSRIVDTRDMAEWEWWLAQVAGMKGVGIGASNIGALQAARDAGCDQLLGDFSLNCMNRLAAGELHSFGVTRLTASLELDVRGLSDLCKGGALPVEVIGQGALPGMLLEYCVKAANEGRSSHEACDQACQREPFSLQDASGQQHRVFCDKRCRNHIYAAADLCVLPNLAQLAAAGVSGVRYEAQVDPAETVRRVVEAYRQALDTLAGGKTIDAEMGMRAVRDALARPLSDGAFGFHKHTSAQARATATR